MQSFASRRRSAWEPVIVASWGGATLSFVAQVRLSTACRECVLVGRTATLSLALADFTASTFFCHAGRAVQIRGRDSYRPTSDRGQPPCDPALADSEAAVR